MIDSKTKLYGIFGNPVRHSLSPLMHNRAFDLAGINAAYVAFEPRSIEEAVSSMKAIGIAGASVTIPFKIDVLPFLDSIDPLAEKIGSVNTLLNDNGRIKGFNTDGHGAVTALKKQGSPIKNEKVLIIGNGGSARAIAYTLLHGEAHVTIAGRDLNRITSLADDLLKFNSNVETSVLAQLDQRAVSQFDIIINTTPIGMHPHEEAVPLDTSLLKSGSTVFDIVYSPHDTRFLTEASCRKCNTVYGIDMLLYQGVRQFEIWTGAEAPVSAMRDILIKYTG